MNALHRIVRTGSARGLLAIALTVATCCFTSLVSAGGTVGPVIDGNLTDLINYASSARVQRRRLRPQHRRQAGCRQRQPDARDDLQRRQVHPVPAAAAGAGHALGERRRNLQPLLRLRARLDDAVPRPARRRLHRRLRRQRESRQLRRRFAATRTTTSRTRSASRATSSTRGASTSTATARPTARSRSRTTSSRAPARSPAPRARSRSARTPAPARPAMTSKSRSTCRPRCPRPSTSSASRPTRSTASPRTAPTARPCIAESGDQRPQGREPADGLPERHDALHDHRPEHRRDAAVGRRGRSAAGLADLRGQPLRHVQRRRAATSTAARSRSRRSTSPRAPRARSRSTPRRRRSASARSPTASTSPARSRRPASSRRVARRSSPTSPRPRVTCKAPPCVQVDITCPATACEGKTYEVSATVTNCSLEAEDITLTIDGQPFYDPGCGRRRHGDAQPSRSPWAPARPRVSRTPRPRPRPTAATSPRRRSTDNCTTLCAPNPCVQFTFTCPGQACAGAPIDLVGQATNCSTGPETITITIDGTPYVIADVAAGATVTPHQVAHHAAVHAGPAGELQRVGERDQCLRHDGAGQPELLDQLPRGSVRRPDRESEHARLRGRAGDAVGQGDELRHGHRDDHRSATTAT